MTFLCNASQSTLIAIDMQERLLPAIHNGRSVVRQVGILAQAARALGVPVVGTAQYPTGLGPNLPEIHDLCDRVIEKTDFNACEASAFLPALDPARNELIVVGCEAHVCVLQTVLGLLDRQHHVKLVVDAIGSRSDFNKAIGIERARDAGAELLTTEMVVFEWLRNSAHPRFKDLMRLIK
jgi:nicotinamidase-related amidase